MEVVVYNILYLNAVARFEIVATEEWNSATVHRWMEFYVFVIRPDIIRTHDQPWKPSALSPNMMIERTATTLVDVQSIFGGSTFIFIMSSPSHFFTFAKLQIKFTCWLLRSRETF